jgi:hypothetical protein
MALATERNQKGSPVRVPRKGKPMRTACDCGLSTMQPLTGWGAEELLRRINLLRPALQHENTHYVENNWRHVDLGHELGFEIIHLLLHLEGELPTLLGLPTGEELNAALNARSGNGYRPPPIKEVVK